MKKTKPTIRKAKSKDLEEFISMKKTYLEGFTKLTGEKISITKKQIEQEFSNILKKRNSNIFILESNKQICGFMIISLLKKRTVSYLDDIFVKPNFQRKGYGKLLFEYFIQFSKEKQVEKMGLGTRAENKPAIAMYKKYGFKIIGYNFGKKLK